MRTLGRGVVCVMSKEASGGCILLAEHSGMSSWEGSDCGATVVEWTFAAKAPQRKRRRRSRSTIPLPRSFRIVPSVARGVGLAYALRRSVRSSIMHALGPHSFCRVVEVPENEPAEGAKHHRRELWEAMIAARNDLQARVQSDSALKLYGCQKSSSLGCQLGNSCCVGPHATGFTSSTQAGVYASTVHTEVARFCRALDTYLVASCEWTWERVKAAVAKWVPSERLLFGMPFDGLWANMDSRPFQKHSDPNESGATLTVSWGESYIYVGDDHRCQRADGEVAFGSYGWMPHGPGGRDTAAAKEKGGGVNVKNFTLTFYLSYYAAPIPVVLEHSLMQTYVGFRQEYEHALIIIERVGAELAELLAIGKSNRNALTAAAVVLAREVLRRAKLVKAGKGVRGNGVLYNRNTIFTIHNRRTIAKEVPHYYYRLRLPRVQNLEAYLRDGRHGRLTTHEWSREEPHPAAST